MIDSSTEYIDHQFDVFRQIGADIDDRVDIDGAENLSHLIVIRAICEDAFHAVGQISLGLPSIEDHDLMPGSRELVNECEAVELGAAHD